MPSTHDTAPTPTHFSFPVLLVSPAHTTHVIISPFHRCPMTRKVPGNGRHPNCFVMEWNSPHFTKYSSPTMQKEALGMPRSHLRAHTLGAVLGILKKNAKFQTLSFPQIKITHPGPCNWPSASLAFLFLNACSSANISWMLSCLVSREIHKSRNWHRKNGVLLHSTHPGPSLCLGTHLPLDSFAITSWPAQASPLVLPPNLLPT